MSTNVYAAWGDKKQLNLLDHRTRTSNEYEVGYGTIPPILKMGLKAKTTDVGSKPRVFQQDSCLTPDFLNLSDKYRAHH